jgi:hypothetical protein
MNSKRESDFSLRASARNENPGGFLEFIKNAKDKPAFKPCMLRNKWPSRPFPIDILLLSIDIRQRVTSKYLKINTLKIEENEKQKYQSSLLEMAFLRI